jgi:hypothetical protein
MVLRWFTGNADGAIEEGATETSACGASVAIGYLMSYGVCGRI